MFSAAYSLLHRHPPHHASIRRPEAPAIPAAVPSLRALPSLHRRRRCSLQHIPSASRKYAVLGAGFAGLSVAWHLLELCPADLDVSIDIIDEVGVGGGASGVAGGLIHPYSPKVRVLWRGEECWNHCLKLLDVAEGAARRTPDSAMAKQIVWRRGILRPAMSLKNANILKENARHCLERCAIETIDSSAARKLVSGIALPFDSAVYIPMGVNIHPKHYLEALFLACKTLAKDLSALGHGRCTINLLQASIKSLVELGGEYDSVIICLGAKIDQLAELSGRLPLRSCRGVVARFELPNDLSEEYGECSPSILSNVWVAAQGPRNVTVGSTWDWNSKDYSSDISEQEASVAIRELRVKASAVYPSLRKWEFVGASGGIRAMPPLTALGSLPLLGSVDPIGQFSKRRSNYWVISGLGARGLLYHGFLGHLMALAVMSGKENIIPSEFTSWKKSPVKEVL